MAPTRPLRVGFQARPQHTDYATMRDAWRRVEDAGADALFDWDHFYPLSGEPEGRHFECWTLLAAMAEVTERVEIGALVVCNSYRNPNLLADMARTVDHVSGGRVILGLGSGWFERDYTEYGYEFGTKITRLHAFRDALPVIEQRLGALNPPPVRKVPVMIGGGGEKVMLRLVAQHADIWHGFGDPDTIRHKCAVLDEWCRKEGRDPAAIERSCNIADLDAASRLDEFVDAGATFFTAGADGRYDLSVLERLIAYRDAVNGTS